MSKSSLEREGDPAPDGVGAIRRFRTGPVVSREEVVVFEPPVQFGYRLLSGLPLVSYRSSIELVPEAGGTLIRWTSTFRPRWPGTGPLMRAWLTMVLREYSTSLAKAAGRSASDS